MRAVFTVIFCCLLSPAVDAASRVAGIVVDASGAPVPGATVTAGTASFIKGDSGTFDIADAPDGEVAVRATARGFAPAVLTIAGNTENARLVLHPAPLTDDIVVTASRGAERLSTPTATTVVTSAELLTSAAGSLDDALRQTPGFSLFRRSSSRVSNPTEADFRIHSRWTVDALAAVTRATFSDTPFQPALKGNRVPQVPSCQLGGNVTYVDPRGFTGSVQGRRLGTQFDDDLNVFTLEGFSVFDASASQQLMRGVHLFGAVENLFDTDYDVGRTPLRTIGWPRTIRVGVRVFLP